ncbi:MAG: hypothetical protein IKU97_02815 [Tidjanibacter sp.]|nr:hypothetical protein [Tidjanibacter sp.]
MTFRLQYIALACIVFGWGCNYTNIPTPNEQWPEASTTSPLSLAAECAEEGVPISQGVVFGGVVTANDRSGNFYRTIVIEDESTAVELHIGLYDLHNLYPIGCRVALRAEGLAVMESDGVVQMGRTISSWADYKVEPLGVPSLIDKRIVVVGVGEPAEPQSVEASELTEEMCGRCVKIDGLRYVGEEKDWGSNPYSSTSNRLFITPTGDSLAVRTSRYADFATTPLPIGEVCVGGILYYDRLFGADMFVLKPRTYDDIQPQK